MPLPDILTQFTPYYKKEDYISVADNIIVNSGYKNKTTTNTIFEPIQTNTHRGPYILHDKRWYFRLVKSDDTYKRARALMDDYNLNELSQHLVICYAPDKLPGNKNTHDKQIRVYAFFDSYLEFYNYMKKFSREDLAFYEVIFGEFPQKPHFDVDISIEEFNRLFPNESVDTAVDLLKDFMITACIELIPNLNIEKDILIYTSHGINKRSFHLVINNKCHDGNKESKAFYSAVLSKVPKYRNFIDHGVYSPRQQFRILWNQKPKSGRPKCFLEEFTYLGKTYTHKYGEKITKQALKEVTMLYESLVGFTSGCVSLPSLIPPRPLNYKDLGSYNNLSDTAIQHCMSLLENKLEEAPFSIKEIRGHYIILKRNSPSYCSICKRIHKAENPFLYVLEGRIYLDCRRSAEHANGEKLFVGYLGLSSDQLLNDSSYIEEVDDVTKGEFNFGGFQIKDPELPDSTKLTLEKQAPPAPQPVDVGLLVQNIPARLTQLAKERSMKKSSITGVRISPHMTTHNNIEEKRCNSVFGNLLMDPNFDFKGF